MRPIAPEPFAGLPTALDCGGDARPDLALLDEQTGTIVLLVNQDAAGGASPTPTPSVASSPSPTPTDIPGEDCFNCIDDEGDSQIDRSDPECPARAMAGVAGLGDPKGRGKAVGACAKTAAKGGAKYTAQILKHLDKCAHAVFLCLQQKAGEPDCVTKATTKCAKELGKITAKDEPKLASTIAKACNAAKVDALDLRAAAGLGYDAEEAACAPFGVPSIDDAADVAACLVGHHACRAAQIFAMLVPRAFEILTLGGRNPAAEFPCLPAGSDGGGLGLADPKGRGKAAVGCEKTLEKEGAKFVKNWLKTVQKCSDKIYACVQTKADVGACVAKTRKTCTKLATKLRDPAKGLTAKLAAKVVKSCGSPKLAAADLLDALGLGFGAHASECAALGVAPLDSAPQVAACIARQHACRADQLLERAFPRLREIVGAGGLDLQP